MNRLDRGHGQIGSSTFTVGLAISLYLCLSLWGCGASTVDKSVPGIFGGRPVAAGKFAGVVGLGVVQGRTVHLGGANHDGVSPGGASHGSALIKQDDTGRLFCSATLISSSVVITAAHCVESFGTDGMGLDKSESLVIVAGPGHDDGIFPRTDSVAVRQIERYPYHRRHPIGTGDVALLSLVRPIEDVKPVRVGLTWLHLNQALAPGQLLTAVGYGVREDRQFGRKFEVTVPVLQSGSQTASFGGDGRSSCFGDSGGPLLTQPSLSTVVTPLTSYQPRFNPIRTKKHKSIGDQQSKLAPTVITGVIGRGRSSDCRQGAIAQILPGVGCWIRQLTGPLQALEENNFGADVILDGPSDELAVVDSLCAPFNSVARPPADDQSNRSGSMGNWSLSKGSYEPRQSVLNAVEINAAQLRARHTGRVVKTLAGRAGFGADQDRWLQTQERLDLSHQMLGSLDFLVEASQLKYLNLRGNLLTELEGLLQLGNLKEVDVTGNRLSAQRNLGHNSRTVALLREAGVKVVGFSAQLDTFYETAFLARCYLVANDHPSNSPNEPLFNALLWYSQTSDCNQANERLLGTESLRLAGRNVKALTYLKGFTKLKRLDLSNNPIDDVEALSQLTDLRYLDLRGTAVQDLTPLRRLQEQGLKIIR